MKFIVTTSNRYLHLLPVFAYLFNKYFDREQEVTVLGYDKPSSSLPENFEFVSMGKQGDVSEWSTDLRKYFESMPDEWFCWMMEDSFVRSWDEDKSVLAYAMMYDGIGRIDLTKDVSKRKHTKHLGVLFSDRNERYRLSTQPSIWNKEFLLHYLQPGMDPWTFEKQDTNDDKWAVVGLEEPPLRVNEGVRKWDPHALDLNGFSEEDIKHIQTLL